MVKPFERLKGKAKEDFLNWYKHYSQHYNDVYEATLPENIEEIRLIPTARVLLTMWLETQGYHFNVQHEGGIGYRISISETNFRTSVATRSHCYEQAIIKSIESYNERGGKKIKNCFVCEKELNQLVWDDHMSEWINSGSQNTFIMGYGSSLDMNEYQFYICDGCVENKVEKGVIKQIKK